MCKAYTFTDLCLLEEGNCLIRKWTELAIYVLTRPIVSNISISNVYREFVKRISPCSCSVLSLAELSKPRWLKWRQILLEEKPRPPTASWLLRGSSLLSRIFQCITPPRLLQHHTLDTLDTQKEILLTLATGTFFFSCKVLINPHFLQGKRQLCKHCQPKIT